MEGSEVSSGCEPRVSLDVFCCRGIEPPQKPQQPRMQLVPEDGDGPRRPALCGREDLVELVGVHGWHSEGASRTPRLLTLNDGDDAHEFDGNGTTQSICRERPG